MQMAKELTNQGLSSLLFGGLGKEWKNLIFVLLLPTEVQTKDSYLSTWDFSSAEVEEETHFPYLPRGAEV